MAITPSPQTRQDNGNHAISLPDNSPEPLTRLNEAEVIGRLAEEFLAQTLTIGISKKGKTATSWRPAEITVADLVNLLTHHEEGPKDSKAFLQGEAIRGERKALAMKALYMVGLDVDCGIEMDTVIEELVSRNLFALLYTTHSHLSTTTEISQNQFAQWAKKRELDGEPDDESIRRYLSEARHYTPAIANTARYVDTVHIKAGVHHIVEHAPMPKFRIVLPLAQPFIVIKEAPTQHEAIKKWKRKLLGLSEMLEVPIDESCLDPSRLFYTPRHSQGRAYRSVVVGGEPLSLADVPEVDPKRRGTKAEQTAEWESIRLPDGSGIKAWAKKHAEGFQIAQLFGKYAPEHIRNHVEDGKLEVECPFDGEHGNAGDDSDRGTWCADAHSNTNSGSFAFHCQHNACSGRDRLDLLAEALRLEWFAPAALLEDNLQAIVVDAAAESESESLDFIFSDEDELVTAINKNWALVVEGGQGRYIQELSDQEFRTVNRETASSILAPFQLIVGEKQPRLISGFNVWQKSPKRREYCDIRFDPNGTPANVYNRWKGFPLEPKQGDWSLMKWHLRNILCSGDGEAYSYVLAWLTNLIQEPGNKLGTALVFRSDLGTGKSTFSDWLGAILGRHMVSVSQDKHLLGNFNAHLQDNLLIVSEEATWAGDKAAAGVLKDLITSHTRMVEPKHVNAIQAGNFSRLIILTNSRWAVPARWDERRFLVMDVSDAKKQNAAYFRSLKEEFANGGPAAMLHDLLNYSSPEVELYNPPKTDALVSQVKESLEQWERWWLDVLFEGSFGGESCDWTGKREVKREDVQASYREMAYGYQRNATAEEIGRHIRTLVPSIQDVRRGPRHGRERYYVFPPLKELRAAFTAKYGVQFDNDVDATENPFLAAANSTILELAEVGFHSTERS